MNESLPILLVTAVSIAVIHTLGGPDHYLPFILMGRAGKWSLSKVLLWTGACGLAHVLSSVMLGLLGIGLGWSMPSVSMLGKWGGTVSAWALVVFGVVYMTIGLVRVIGHQRHGHSHPHAHSHGRLADRWIGKKTFWALVLVFVLGPCEPLIPMLLVPAASHSILAIVSVSLVFMVATIAVMLGLVAAAYVGFELFEFGFVRRYMHPLTGFTVALCGWLLVGLG